MNTHFISIEVNLQSSPIEMQSEIEAELRRHGEPLRWAVTSVNANQQKAQIEAIVTIDHD